LLTAPVCNWGVYKDASRDWSELSGVFPERPTGSGVPAMSARRQV